MTDVTLTAVTDTLTQFGLAQGSVHLRSFGLDPERRWSWTRPTSR
jgi:hypothetical protein